jgi:hypothetical protein
MFKNRALSLMVLLAVPLVALAQDAQTAANQTKAPFNEETLMKSVVRITVKLRGENKLDSGTGFFISVADDRLPAGQRFQYLVTNRHVAFAIFKDGGENCKAHEVEETYITYNLKSDPQNHRIRTEKLDTSGLSKWVTSDDAGVDLAIIPAGGTDALDAISIDLGMFVTSANWTEKNFHPGDKLLTTGYFSHYSGTHEFQPIVREGSLAMVPDGKMGGVLCHPAKVFLADLHIIPGNSGSPLFIGLRGFLGGLVAPNDGGSPYMLLGVISGYMYEDLDLDLRPASDFDKVVHSNSGVAMVVPAEEIAKLLSSPLLKQGRDDEIKRLATLKKQ